MSLSDNPRVLTYRFHQFRPSDRAVLKTTALSEKGDQVFVAALELYLQKWADADWLTEYDLERIGQWTEVHLPKVSGLAHKMVCRKLSSAHNEQSKQTYTVMLRSLSNQKHSLPA